MELKVPERDENALADLIALSDADVAKLADAIEAAPISLLLTDLCGHVAEATTFDGEKVSRIVRLLASLNLIRAREDVPIDEFAEGVRVAVQSAGKPALQPRSGFKEHLIRLLGLRTLFVSAKALDVMREQPRAYCKSRIVTDLRPVFDRDEIPAASVVMHLLKIAYHTGPRGEIQEFFVAMSGEDIKGLQEVLSRAIRKESSINALIAKTELPVLELEFHNRG